MWPAGGVVWFGARCEQEPQHRGHLTQQDVQVNGILQNGVLLIFCFQRIFNFLLMKSVVKLGKNVNILSKGKGGFKNPCGKVIWLKNVPNNHWELSPDLLQESFRAGSSPDLCPRGGSQLGGNSRPFWMRGGGGGGAVPNVQVSSCGQYLMYRLAPAASIPNVQVSFCGQYLMYR